MMQTPKPKLPASVCGLAHPSHSRHQVVAVGCSNQFWQLLLGIPSLNSIIILILNYKYIRAVVDEYYLN